MKKMTRNSLILGVVALTSTLLLTACASSENAAPSTTQHVHTYGEWTIIKEATCTEDGVRVHYCVCGDTKMETIPANGLHGLTYTVNADGISCTITGKGECPHTEISIEEYIDGYKVTAIGANAFKTCNSITKITIPASVTEIHDFAFAFCDNLTSVIIPDSVIEIGSGAFSCCTKLANIILPDNLNLDTFYPTSIFGHCMGLQYTVFDNGKYLGTSSNPYFVCCGPVDGREVSSIQIHQDTVLIAPNAFLNCHSLVSVKIPDGVAKIGSSAFANCRNLTSIVLPNSITTIETCTFQDCIALSNIVIPEGVTHIESLAFFGCSNLTNIKIPTSIKTLGWYAFATTIGSASAKCVIEYDGTVAQWNAIVKMRDADINTSLAVDFKEIICIDGSVTWEAGIVTE